MIVLQESLAKPPERDLCPLKKEHVTYHTASDQETIALGRELGAAIREGDVIALVGELGTGKTWFTKGVAIGMGVPRDTIITSPSFSLVNEYRGRYTLYHMDAYRLESLSDFLSTGLEEYFYQGGVVAMEWADRWHEVLPGWRLKVELTIVDEHSRRISLSGHHPRAVEILRSMGK
ncbi:MAG: tRNA (adenosine(37)-N6)-threonylcarbamoyltransferase complex ATPase subunit type 1 TsaE [Thermodesulfobacteriota bacterium]|nr:tRNA (adenosine(37)-N6)-threonylcarbamoyltransferase complex ATPase subunit type 1 TsaE [Thermodesulfobacteriota bacterium]